MTEPSSTQRVNPFSAGIDFIRQMLTSADDPHTERINIFIMAVDP